MSARLHDYRLTGILCGDGCLLLAEPARLRRRAQRYLVDLNDLQSLIASTGGWCMVCRGCHASIVEHCHATGRVRGLVCRWCNARISNLEGGTSRREVVYRRSYGCQCAPTNPQQLRAWSARLENATYGFLDHAMDPIGISPRAAFHLLALGAAACARPPASVPGSLGVGEQPVDLGRDVAGRI